MLGPAMNDARTTAPDPIAYSIAGAAAAIGRESNTIIKVALSAGDLVARYYDSHPLILHKDLAAWAESLGTEKP